MQNIKNSVNDMLAEQCRVTEMEANKKKQKKPPQVQAKVFMLRTSSVPTTAE